MGLGLGLDIGRIEDATLSQSKATERTLVISPLEGKIKGIHNIRMPFIRF